MSEKLVLSQKDVYNKANILAEVLINNYLTVSLNKSVIKVYGVPRGGLFVLCILASISPFIVAALSPEDADVIVDDLIDSGETAKSYQKYNKPFHALYDKTIDSGIRNHWLVFPWEVNESIDTSQTSVITRLLQILGEDPTREGLSETPKRVIKAWQHWTSGYGKDPKDILKVFEDGGERYDQMVLVKDIPIYSKCEHHLADIIGTASIAYIPNGKIVGLSKLSRLADIYARRLQVQERLTQQIADALENHLQPKGVGVLIRARHMCMESRGICQQGHETFTTAFHGVLLNDINARQEFMALVCK